MAAGSTARTRLSDGLGAARSVRDNILASQWDRLEASDNALERAVNGILGRNAQIRREF